MLQVATFALMVAMAPPDVPPVAETAAQTRVGAAPATDSAVISAEQWARPRSGQSVARLQSLSGVIHQFNERAGQRIVVRYAGGDEGNLWAEELRAWLIALGIPSDRIDLTQAAVEPDALIIEIKTSGDTEH